MMPNTAPQRTGKNPAAQTDWLASPPHVHPEITATTNQHERAQLDTSHLQEATDEAIVDHIVKEGIDPHCIATLNNKYTACTNKTIKSILYHVKTEWMQIINKDETDAKEALKEPWEMISEITMMYI